MTDQHEHIASHVPDAEILKEGPTPTHLGSFVLDEVNNGDFLPVKSTMAFEADFDKIAVLDAERDLPQEFTEYKEELASDPARQELAQTLADLPERERELFTTALFGVTIAQEFFAKEPIDKRIRDTTGWTPVDASRSDTYKIKKLSDTADSGICVEYSLVVGEVMKRLGQKTKFTAGYRQLHMDDPGIYHGFLSVEDVYMIADPLLIAETMSSRKPLGMFKASGATIADLPYEGQLYDDIFGRTAIYSASPIPSLDQWRWGSKAA